MLRITLYGNCCLNDKYQVEFSHKIRVGYTLSYFERYLQTRPKITFDIDMTYYENTGILNFDLELIQNISIYTYNYMKIQYLDEEENIKLIRFCFISDIEIKNDVVYLSYEEDIYNSYIDNIIGCLPSFMSRKRVNALGWSPTCNLPVDYDGNNILNFNTLETLTDEYYIIAQLQPYTTESAGDPAIRFSTYVKIAKALENDNYDFIFSLAQIEKAIQELQYYKQIKSLLLDGISLPIPIYYDISDIYVIPKNLFNSYHLIPSTSLGKLLNTNSEALYKFFEFDNVITRTSMYATTLENDFKRIKVGTITQSFDIINNGTDIILELESRASRYNFSIYLNLSNSLIDISDSFRINVPFDYLNGDILAQQRIQREMATINGVVKIGTGIVQTGLDIATAGATGISLFGDTGKTITTKIRSKTKSGNMKWKTTTKRIPGKTSGLDLVGDVTGGIGKIATGITDLIESNAPVYSSSKGIYGSIDAFYNLKYGLVEFTIISDNEDFVKQLTNETGLIVYSIVNSNNIDMIFQDNSMENQYSYDIVKFDSCNLYGKFPANIANKLNEIFESGVKIIYDDTETPVDRYFEDNYV